MGVSLRVRPTAENNGSLGLFLKELYEPEARSLPALSRRGNRQLVIDGETLPVIAHLDDETVRMKLVHDLDGTFPAVAIGVPNRVRAGLGDRELEIAECFVVEGT
jgi:hypothetical protein